MKEYDVVVVGGSAGGIPSAVTAKRHYPDKRVLLIRSEEKVLIPCGIPYIFGTVMNTDKNLIPDGVLTKNEIDLMVDETVSIDRAQRTVTTKGGEKVGYDKLILATGSVPLAPPIPGLDKENVFFAKKDVSYLDDFLTKIKRFKNVVVLGGGFIGVEFADELKKRGLEVTIVEMLPHCLMLAFDEDICEECEAILRDRGVNIITDAKLVEVVGDKAIRGVKLSNGQELKADALLVGIGVRPSDELAKAAELKTDRGGIVVDASQRTSDEHIFAVGDCATKACFFTGKPSPMKLASIATIEGRVAGANLFQDRRKNPGVVSVFCTAIGNYTIAIAGMTEKAAREKGFEVITTQTEAPDRHPGGMPGMSKMKVKLVFDKETGVLIGGAARGGPCVGEVINTISACIQNRMTADALAQFQLGTHPAVTASPIAYQLVNAAELAVKHP